MKLNPNPRIKAGYSRAEAAKAIGCSERAIEYWENGLRTPGVQYVYKFSKLYSCTMEELLEQ